MSIPHYGDFPVGATVRIPWNTNAADGASITRATDGTCKIVKDGGTTERASSAGVTAVEDHDGDTGTHFLSIDLSNDSDPGFYAAGHEYAVKYTGMDIDGKTVNAWIGSFSIERSGGILDLVKLIKAQTDNLPSAVKANTALNNFEFLMVSVVDHMSPKTGLTITATRSIDGGAFAACANSASEVGVGIYKINLAAADLNGTVITFRFTATGADDRYITLITRP